MFYYHADIKENMDKDLDEISKIARGLKGKLEALDGAVSAIIHRLWKFYKQLNIGPDP